MRSKTVLVVENDPNDMELTLRALRKSNIPCEIITVEDGSEALDYLFRRGKFKSNDSLPLPDLVLLDLKMPRVNGLEVLREIRSSERTKYLPVVVLTTSDEENDIISSYKFGANSYVRKPADFRQFLTEISQIGSYWMFVNKPPILI